MSQLFDLTDTYTQRVQPHIRTIKDIKRTLVMALNIQLLKFLAENAHWIVKPPINGSKEVVHILFNSNNNEAQISWMTFKDQLGELKVIDKYAIEYDKHDGNVIVFINSMNLGILIGKLMSSSKSGQREKKIARKRGGKRKKQQQQLLLSKPSHLSSQPSDILVQLNEILNVEPPELLHLRSLLNYQSTAHRLTLERISKITPRVPFLETCDYPNHSQYLALNNDTSKLPHDLVQCLSQKDPFHPNYQTTYRYLPRRLFHTLIHDVCRYLHYKRHIPHQALDRSLQQCDDFNNEIPYWEMISPWCRNGSTSNLSREILPPQWINCDVRTFDFNIVGKSAAVIADPAWNIHMNLPYGTCNDTELLSLPLHTVQDEGILLLWVTGRAIEIGKSSLENWGYKIKNEVVWIKTNQLDRTICTGRTGHWLNHSKEHLLVGVKGNPDWLDKLVDVDFIVSGTRETSRKPDENKLYGMVERLVGPHARKLEIFGRTHNTRPGWFSELTLETPISLTQSTNTHTTAIGNQLNGTQIHECDVLERYINSKED
ncbi:N6-adenosine-methyltransferase IME4 [Cyberlindnera fabianii]|uniref:mRNA m(6)A methyltransferase n=1 Tax=Cyberlindnera fabianii TaxID=36022 RepID=A0A1V2LEB6_CYBFA|nr:N6-adenosine-methyltransferase IME4 [Cyberlindnera fabianii]